MRQAPAAPPEAPVASPHPDPAVEARRDAARRWTPPHFETPCASHYNRLGLDFAAEAAAMPPAVTGHVVDAHTHLLSLDHAADWFRAADLFGVDHTITMSPLEEAVRLLRSPFAGRLTLIAVPAWQPGGYDADAFWPRVRGFHDVGSRVVKFHLAPGTMQKSGLCLGGERVRRYVGRAIDLDMIVMTHIGDPELWYARPDRYGGDPDFWGTRERHYDAWEQLLEDTRGHPWWGAHLGGWPENPTRLDHLLTTYPDLVLDLSATTWMVREVSARRDELRAFVLKHQDRLLWGSDQVSHHDRNTDFYAGRWWCHRKLWESTYDAESTIHDPLCGGGTAMLRGLHLPADVLTKLYRTNVTRLLRRVRVDLPA